MPRPSILIIPGASATPEFYTPLIAALTTDAAQAYEISALHLPSVGKPDTPNASPAPSMYDDVAFIQAHIAALADAGKDVLLITHSYGGAPGTQSVQGYGKTERNAKGLKGGVVGIAYITSLVPELGMPAGSVQASMPSERKVPMSVDDGGWLYYTDVPRLAELSFSDMPGDEGMQWARKLANHSSAAFASPLTYQGFKDVPVFYLLCKSDLVIPPSIQQAGIDMIERVTGEKVKVTAIDADHVAPLSHTREVVDWVVGVMGRLEKGSA